MKMEYVYYIPTNFTDGGKILGNFEIKHVIEAGILSPPVLYLIFRFLPFSVTTKMIVAIILVVPVAGFALMGIRGFSLSEYVRIWHRWRKERRIIEYRGCES
jgi:hypothetical protein